MATSGTTTFGNTELADFVLYALGRCGIRRAQITQDHLVDARMAANLVLSAWGNDQPNLWKVALYSQTLVAGTATYTLAASVLSVLDCYVETTNNSVTIGRPLFPVSRTEYAGYPNKELEQPPTVYWFNRVVPPTITLYPVPDDAQTYTLKYYAVSQDEDAEIASGTALDIPIRFVKAFVDALSAELAITYAPDRAAGLSGLADRSLRMAQAEDAEDVTMYILPGLSAYRNR